MKNKIYIDEKGLNYSDVNNFFFYCSYPNNQLYKRIQKCK